MDMSGQLHTLATLYPRKHYQLDRKVGWPQNRSEYCGEDKISCPISFVRLKRSCYILAELFWLHENSAIANRVLIFKI